MIKEIKIDCRRFEDIFTRYFVPICAIVLIILTFINLYTLNSRFITAIFLGMNFMLLLTSILQWIVAKKNNKLVQKEIDKLMKEDEDFKKAMEQFKGKIK